MHVKQTKIVAWPWTAAALTKLGFYTQVTRESNWQSHDYLMISKTKKNLQMCDVQQTTLIAHGKTK